MPTCPHPTRGSNPPTNVLSYRGLRPLPAASSSGSLTKDR
jgi:hypothetical protein